MTERSSSPSPGSSSPSRASARHRAQDRAAADLPPAARAGQRRPARSPPPSIAVRDEVVFCDPCFNISTGPLCPICLDPARDDARLCVVEEPLDVLALERTGAFQGRYHVLHGAISPMDGIGPDRLACASCSSARAERDAERASRSRRSSSPPTRPSRVRPRRCTSPSGSRATSARSPASPAGIPVGGDLEYADEVTLVRAHAGPARLSVER